MAPRRPTLFRRSLNRIALAFGAVVLLAYPLDWACWKALSLTGRGMGLAFVSEVTAATLKGNHFEVYAPQKAEIPCSRSLLPEGGAEPCWWLRRHPDIVSQY